jgi:hypothetical protein
MNEKQIQEFIDRIEARRAKGYTKEEAILRFQEIGILDENGDLSPDHQNFPYLMETFPNRYDYL